MSARSRYAISSARLLIASRLGHGGWRCHDAAVYVGSMDAIKAARPRRRAGAARLALRCRGWEQEGVLRCLLNMLDPAVAEDSARLVVYGGRGRAARSWADYDAIWPRSSGSATTRRCSCSPGRPVPSCRRIRDAPRVLISTAMLVPAWSDEDEFRRLEDAGLTMYGQMTAASWFYIGTQGILGFTHETFAAVARRHFDGTLAGRRVVTAGLGGMGGAQGLAIANLGRARADRRGRPRARRAAPRGRLGGSIAPRLRGGGGRPDDSGEPAAIGLVGQRRRGACRGSSRDGVAIDVATDQTPAHDIDGGYVPSARAPPATARARVPRAARRALAARARRRAARPARARRDRLRVRQQPARPGRRGRRGPRAAAAGLRRRVRAADPRARRRPVPLGLPERRPATCAAARTRSLEVVGSPSLERWFALARARVPAAGPAGAHLLARPGPARRRRPAPQRARAPGEIGPLALGRDHMDPAIGRLAVARDRGDARRLATRSPTGRSSARCSTRRRARRGSRSATAAASASGAASTARSPWSPTAASGRRARSARVFWTDPALGVVRYADAGYPEALARAAEAGLDIPSHRGAHDAGQRA